MIIAVPTTDGILCQHFGHCEAMQLFRIENGEITKVVSETPPPHAPSVIPKWLSELGANTIIAGGMGQKAIDIFEGNGVRVIIGAAPRSSRKIVVSYLAGSLEIGHNVCDH